MDWDKLLTKDNAVTAGEIIGGFIPGISEAIDTKDFVQGVKNKKLCTSRNGFSWINISCSKRSPY